MNKFLVVCILLASLSIVAQAASTKPRNAIAGSWGSGKKFINVQAGLKVRVGDVNYGNGYTVKFDYKAPAAVNYARNFFRVTNSDKKCCNKKDRRLVIHIPANGNALNISTVSKKSNAWNFNTQKFVVGETYKIKIVFDRTRVIVYVNYKPVQARNQGNITKFNAAILEPTKNADLYIGDKWMKPAGDGIFKKLRILDAPMFLADELCVPGNNLGHLRRNVWFQGFQHYSPCGNQLIDLPNKFTIQFQYKTGPKASAKWDSVFSFHSKYNSHTGPRLYVLPKTHAKFALYGPSKLKKSNYFAMSPDSVENFKQGDIIDVKLIYDKVSIHIVINNQVVASQYSKELLAPYTKLVFFAGNAYFGNPAAKGNIKRLTLTRGKALYPIKALCNTNVFGQAARNRWFTPIQAVIPCPGNTINFRSSYTLEFDYWPREKKAGMNNIMQIMPLRQTYNCCNKNTRRQPAIFMFSNSAQLSFRVTTIGAGNGGINSIVGDFVFGEKYRVQLIVDGNTAYYSVNGEVRQGKFLKTEAQPVVKGVAWVGNKWYKAATNASVKRMKITKKVMLPGRNLCSSNNPWGIYSGNRPTKPVRGFMPCNKNIKKLGSTFTIKFKYIPRQTQPKDTSLFRFTATQKECCGRDDRAPALRIIKNSFDFNFQIGTNKGGNIYVLPKFDFKSDVSYAIKITVIKSGVVTIFVDDREVYTNPDCGGVPVRVNVALYVSDNFFDAAGVEIYKASITEGAVSCVKIYSECNFQGQSTSICDSSQNLKNDGWNYPVKSVRVPADFKNKVVLHTQTDYNGEKLVLTKDKKCIQSNHYSFLQVHEAEITNE